jgi:hypothetical protein
VAGRSVRIRWLEVCLAAAGSLLPAAARADDRDGWTLSGSFRIRYEALTGQFRPGLDPSDDLVSMRTTLFAEHHAGPIHIGAELYDSRAYGGEAGSAVSANDVNALELVQAYLAADLPLGAGSTATLQAGRFIMRLGSRRRSDEEEYRNTMPSFTGLRADLKTRSHISATLFLTLPQLRLPDDQPSVLANKVRLDRESFDMVFWGGMITGTRAWRNISFDAGYAGLGERDSPGRPTRNRRLHSLMARLVREPARGKLDFAAEAAYQLGSIRAGLAPQAAPLDVSASYFHADLGYTMSGPLGLRLAAEYDRASGDGDGPAYGRFDPLFGIRRIDLAPSGLYGAIARANIDTPALRAEIRPSKRWDAFALVRAMWAEKEGDGFSATGVRGSSGSGRFAGFQLEARLRYWLVSDRLRAQANAALLIKRGLLADAPNAPRTGDAIYTAASLTATF